MTMISNIDFLIHIIERVSAKTCSIKDADIPTTLFSENLTTALNTTNSVLTTGKQVVALAGFLIGRSYWNWCKDNKRNPWAKSYPDFKKYLEQNFKIEPLRKLEIAKIKNGIVIFILNMWMNEGQGEIRIGLPTRETILYSLQGFKKYFLLFIDLRVQNSCEKNRRCAVKTQRGEN